MSEEVQNKHDETLYNRIGGETGVRDLVTLFYDQMERLPEADTIRKLHRPDLTEARQKLFEYFTGWFGGPPLYVSQYGHPRLRARHNHAPIGVAERDAWLICLVNALKQMELDDDLLVDLLDKIVPMADHMRNRQEEEL